MPVTTASYVVGNAVLVATITCGNASGTPVVPGAGAINAIFALKYEQGPEGPTKAVLLFPPQPAVDAMAKSGARRAVKERKAVIVSLYSRLRRERNEVEMRFGLEPPQ